MKNFLILFLYLFLLIFAWGVSTYPMLRVLSLIFWERLKDNPYLYILFALIPQPIVIAGFLGRSYRNVNWSFLRWSIVGIGHFCFFYLVTLLPLCVLGEIVILVSLIPALGAIYDNRKYLGITIFALHTLIYSYGCINGSSVVKKTFNIKTTLKRGVKIVHISDLHIGTQTKRWLRKVIKKVNSIKADVVVITGDLADSPSVVNEIAYDEMIKEGKYKPCDYFRYRSHDLDPLVDLDAPLGVYFVFVCIL